MRGIKPFNQPVMHDCGHVALPNPWNNSRARCQACRAKARVKMTKKDKVNITRTGEKK